MQTYIIIPARYASSRFPGKPLTSICGHSMLERVWRIAKAVRGVDEIIIATDDERIAEHANAFGGQVSMTGDAANGTERVALVAKDRCQGEDLIFNLQGDALLTPPWVIQSVIDAMRADERVGLASPMVKLTGEVLEQFIERKRAGSLTGTTVVVDKSSNALYFSKGVIPNIRDRKALDGLNQHIGLYAYRYQTLNELVSLPAPAIEQIEGLEQLRALYNEIPIKMVEVDYQGRTHGSIDSPEDAPRAEAIIQAEGELVQW